MSQSWYEDWFNEDYLRLYAYHDQEEAERHITFLIEKAGLRGSEKILDLGCGSGRHLLAFAKRGYSVVGVDASEVLLREAKTQLEGQNLSARLVRGDLFELGSLGEFDLVISMFTSFGYSDDDQVNASVFNTVRENLRQGGQFFLDYLHPDQVKRTLIPYEEKEVNGKKVVIEKEIVEDRVIKSIIFPDRTYHEKVKLYTREQIEGMVAESGFKVLHCWNDYQGNPWRHDGDRQLFHAIVI